MQRPPLGLLEGTLCGGENGEASRESCCACRRRGERKHLSPEGLRIFDVENGEGNFKKGKPVGRILQRRSFENFRFA